MYSARTGIQNWKIVDSSHYSYGFIWSKSYHKAKEAATENGRDIGPFGEWMMKKLVDMLPSYPFMIFIDSGLFIL